MGNAFVQSLRAFREPNSNYEMNERFYRMARGMAGGLARSFVGRCYSETVRLLGRLEPSLNYKSLPPWMPPQALVETAAHRFAGCGQESIRTVLIVGGYLAYEVNRMHRAYPRARFVIFEPSVKYFAPLQNRFSKFDWVTCERMAVSSEVGKLQFYETNVHGTGSLLTPRSAPGSKMRQADSFCVEATTLDAYCSGSDYLRGRDIDILWVDVQGAENRVLEGARDTLRKTKLVMLEIALEEPEYEGGATFPLLNNRLTEAGFTLISLGVGPDLSGNAVWVRR